MLIGPCGSDFGGVPVVVTFWCTYQLRTASIPSLVLAVFEKSSTSKLELAMLDLKKSLCS